MKTPVSAKSRLALPKVGVGLRHAHYEMALSSPADVDFVEVHTENFYVDGGANLAVLEQVREHYDISLHCTALGLGSAAGISGRAVAKLADLVARFDPILVSDHLCFCWVDLDGRRVHTGDLLPVQRTQESLTVLKANIDRVQQAIGRPLLIENVTAYVEEPLQNFSETEFLCRLVEATGCGLLVDLNNLLVNAHNLEQPDPVAHAMSWLDQIPAEAVGEFHLAGYTPVPPGEIAVDDHGAAVSRSAWRVYEYALAKLGDAPTLIEWDNALPDWPELQAEATRAQHLAGAARDSRQ